MGKDIQSQTGGVIDTTNKYLFTEASMPFYDTLNLNVSSRVFTTVRVRRCAMSPVGLFGFAFACFTTGLGNLELISYSHVTLTAYFVFGGLLQYAIGVLDWVQGNTLNSLLSILYGGYNISCLFWDYFADKAYAPKYSGNAFGIFNLIWMITMIAAAIAVWRKGSKIAFANYCLVVLVCLFNMLSGFTNLKAFRMIAGVDYLIISLSTSYIGFAVIINGTYGKTLLPLFALGEKLSWMNKE